MGFLVVLEVRATNTPERNPPCPTHLTPQERYVISHLKVAKYSLREIARRLGRHHTTISREIERKGPTYPGGVYWYYFIDPVVEKKRHKARSYWRQNHAPLVRHVEDKLG